MANQIIAGIDIGSTKVAVAIAVVENDETPRIIGEASYASSGVKKGEIAGIEDAISSIAQALTAAERMAGLTISSAFVSINGKHIISNNNKGVVATDDNEINADDVFRAMDQAKTIAIPAGREIIHLIPREFIVDTSTGIKDPIGMTGTRLEVDAHIISATTTALHNLRKSIETLGLRIEGEIFTGWAASQSVLTSTERELGVLLLDIGGGTTSIATFEEGALSFSTSVPFGGHNVTRDLAAGLRLSLDDAEKVKLNIGRLIDEAKDKPSKSSDDSDSDDEEDGKKKKERKRDSIDVSELEIEGVKTISHRLFKEIVDARIEETFQIVRDTVVQAGFEHKLPAGIILTGGSAELPGLTSLAKEVFGVPARIGSPRGLEGITEGVSSPGYAVLQGLIMEGMHSDEYNVGRGTSPVSGGGGQGGLSKVTDFLKNLLP